MLPGLRRSRHSRRLSRGHLQLVDGGRLVCRGACQFADEVGRVDRLDGLVRLRSRLAFQNATRQVLCKARVRVKVRVTVGVRVRVRVTVRVRVRVDPDSLQQVLCCAVRGGAGLWQGRAGREGLSRDNRTISMCWPSGSVSSSMSWLFGSSCARASLAAAMAGRNASRRPKTAHRRANSQ